MGKRAMAEGYFQTFFKEEYRLGMGASGTVYLCQVRTFFDALLIVDAHILSQSTIARTGRKSFRYAIHFRNLFRGLSKGNYFSHRLLCREKNCGRPISLLPVEDSQRSPPLGVIPTSKYCNLPSCVAGVLPILIIWA